MESIIKALKAAPVTYEQVIAQLGEEKAAEVVGALALAGGYILRDGMIVDIEATKSKIGVWERSWHPSLDKSDIREINDKLAELSALIR